MPTVPAMSLLKYITSIDCIHPSNPRAKRELQGSVFGIELPAWVIFHAMLGYVLLGVGLVSVILRLPFPWSRRWSRAHRVFGFVWIFGTVWMPVTAIWCVYEFVGWDIIAFFIFSMYATIQAAWCCIKYYRYSTSKDEGYIDTVALGSRQIAWRIRAYKWAHATLMIYSFCMLLGAGISFPFRAYQDYGYHSGKST